jgi:DNA-binding beta-propeller fold protein YncE
LNQVTVFDAIARAARALGASGPGRLVTPMGLAIDRSGDVYVADRGGRRVVAFAPSDQFLRAYGGPELMLNPVDVAVDAKAGLVYVADSFLHQVLVFRKSDGALLRRMGRSTGRVSAAQRAASAPSSHGGNASAAIAKGEPRATEPRDVVANRGVEPGEFRYPSFIAVGPNGALYVSDALNSRVQVFDRDGRFVQQMGRNGDGPGTFARPKGVAVDSEGHVYVADAAFNNVQIFDDQARLLLAFGRMGRADGEFDLPAGLFIDANDRIYAADRSNNRVQIFQYLRAGMR